MQRTLLSSATDSLFSDVSSDALLSEVITLKRDKLIQKLIRNADIKYPQAGLESLGCEARDMDKNKIVNLASMGFVSAATNLIITGLTGAGKTYLASVPGIESCRMTLRTCYVRMPDMLSHVQTHKGLGNYKLLIINEWLNYRLNEKESRFIYELIDQRRESNPTVFVSQFGVADWHERPGGGTVADSIMDRIIHNSYELPASDNNMRKLYDSRKARSVIDSL